MTSDASCYHCGEALPAQAPVAMRGEETLRFCCAACRAVYELIHGAGFDRYYNNRREASARPAEVREDFSAMDLPEVQADFVRRHGDLSEARLLIDGIHCSACTWLLEHYLGRLTGVESVSVQLDTREAQIRWRSAELPLSRIFTEIAALGYRPLPARVREREQLQRAQQRDYLLRIGVAGIAAMQVGMFAIALYAGGLEGMDEHWRQLLRLFSLLLATAVVAYSARPFFGGAWRNLRVGSVGMDVPVALAIGLAYSASVWATWRGEGEVYFDSVTMFTFFLLVGRFLELRARSRLGGLPQALLPETALRRKGDALERIALRQLQLGDRVLVRAGESIPVDGRVCSGESCADESAFSGEFMPVAKHVGDHVLAGSVNGDGVLEIEVTAVQGDAAMAGVERLIERALAQKPHIAQMAERLSRHFVAAVLLLCAITAVYWVHVAPEHALWAVLSVLVVSCPCALGLATPAAITAAVRRLQRMGVLVTGAHVLEALPQIRHVVLDKTGTLTEARARLGRVLTLPEARHVDAVAIAGALEAQSSHPLARAFDHAGNGLAAREVRHVTGQGVEGVVAERHYRLGSAAFCGQWLGAAPALPDDEAHWLALCVRDEHGAAALLAWFEIIDPLRRGAAGAVDALRAQGLQVHLLSGDASGAVAGVAGQLGIAWWRAGASAADKLAYVQRLQQQGAVLMVGDGINDIPVLAAAEVSVAVADATDLSKARADAILLTSSLDAVPNLIAMAQSCRRTIRQNLAWALGYNGIAVPLAMMGLVPPYLAALGMSLSSLLVVGNALRLLRTRLPGEPARKPPVPAPQRYCEVR